MDGQRIREMLDVYGIDIVLAIMKTVAEEGGNSEVSKYIANVCEGENYPNKKEAKNYAERFRLLATIKPIKTA